MIEILENNFQVLYSEYKEYDNFIKDITPKLIKEGSDEELSKFAAENESNTEAVADKLFETKSLPYLYQTDLVRLKNRLYDGYLMVKDVIKIPAEIVSEIEAIKYPQQLFNIEGGQAKEIDGEHNKKLKEEAKKYYLTAVKQLIK